MQSFTETFPTLQLDPHMSSLVQGVSVEKITAPPTQDRLTVYLHSTHLIQRDDLHALEAAIGGQLLKKGKITIHIHEQYHLSSQYTPQALWEHYGASVIAELGEKSRYQGQALKDAGITFSRPDCMEILFEDNVLIRQREQMILNFLREIFEERCQLPVQIRLDYKQPARSQNEIYREQATASEVEEILRRVEGSLAVGVFETEESMAPIESRLAEHEHTAQNTNWQPSKKELRAKRASKMNDTIARTRRNARMVTDENMIYGRAFDGEDIALDQVDELPGEIICRGRIMHLMTREIRNEKTIIMADLTDYTDSIRMKLFVNNEELPRILDELREGVFIRVHGFTNEDKFDNEIAITTVRGIQKISDFRIRRTDNAIEKRVELHCHTKMSDMDGISAPAEIVKGALRLGHKAVAITDHGVVHGFPEAFHTLKYDKKAPEDFKIIYGMEGYLVDDLIDLVVNEKDQPLYGTQVVFDLETTGFNSIHDRIIEIGAVKVTDGKIVDRFSTFVNPKIPIPFRITEVTSIRDADVLDAPTIEEVLPKFLEFVGDAVLVAHNAGFDMGFINQNCRYQEIRPDFTSVDTVALARILLPSLNKYKLDAVAKHLGISLEHHHRAVDDAECTALIWIKFMELLAADGIQTMAQINCVRSMTPDMIRKLPLFHIIILAKNEEGRKNLYRLVSMSHMTFFGKRPRIPKSELIKHREGLILSSACVSGELFDALISERSEDRIKEIVEFYDYLEVQPIANNRFLITEEKYHKFDTDEDLRNLNRTVIELGEKYNKPVVATCDVHFLNPEDEIGRRIIQYGNGYADADREEPLFLRTTQEMLDEFSYLDGRKAYEIVVTNSNLIAGMIEKIEPVRPDKCPPVIPDSDKILRESSYKRAHEMYGDPLPEIVRERLEKELNSIIGNGYSVMYIIAQKLVKKSNEDGYLVGSRGSVGSSLVAHMAGITEVNALQAHYYCPDCKYSDFDSETVKAYAGGCGFDMPDAVCPKCGALMKKAGFNIPFETFLGFKGNKEPDIDLNFSGEYQARAHKYTEEIFGQGQTFKAGTIATVADKTAYGYVKRYYEEHGRKKRNCEIERIMQYCTGVRRSTGQHPGGIIVLPHGEEIHTFTPIQHPANDMTTDIITTHFDYHSIDHNLLKLDILGHDDPTMIKRLEELTGIDALAIPLDDPGVLELFAGTEVLGISPADIHGCKMGTLGVPEFGTNFVLQMLADTKPKTFSDLVRISGLSHGTNVWLDNAQTLIAEGKTDLSGTICTRDDIMTFLISKGVEKSMAFDIMESVRKGKGLKSEWEEAMTAADVPDWYIWSCKRISYMFPKAHAVAYVTMAYRIAYCKINYPLAYYAAYFGIRASAFSYELMCLGKEQLERNFEIYLHIEHPTAKEEDVIKDMRVVEEMYARGFRFLPIDLYRAKATHFQIIDGAIMPSFASIDGMGEKAAESLEAAAKDGPFLSKNDLKERAKLSATIVAKMGELGLLGNLPEADQLSLFDMI